MPRPLLAFAFLTAVSACHKAPQAIGGVSPDDAAALNNAADMLDTSADDLTTPTNGASNAGDSGNVGTAEENAG